jgi:hypothetical protein
MDLLTAVVHELGHVLDHQHHDADGIMHGKLHVGVRRTS